VDTGAEVPGAVLIGVDPSGLFGICATPLFSPAVEGLGVPMGAATGNGAFGAAPAEIVAGAGARAAAGLTVGEGMPITLVLGLTNAAACFAGAGGA
jgi:hypothetical protein